MKKKYFFSAFVFFLMIFVTFQTLSAQTLGFAQSASKKPAPPTNANGWSGASAISPICQPDPTRGSQLNDLAVNASGTAIAAWDQFTYNGSGGATIGAAIQSAGKWGAPFTISGTNGFAQSPKVAIGADGTMAVSWTYQDPISLPSPQNKVQVAVKPEGATAWTITTLAQGPIGGVAIIGIVPVAVDPNGNVTAVWNLWNGAIHVVQSSLLTKNGVWSVPVNLAPGVDGLYLCLALNAKGDAAVAFTVSPYSSYLTGTFAEYVFRSGLNGAWTIPVTISETMSSSVGYITSPMVALDANGLATVAYMGYGVEAMRQRTDGSWTGPKTVLQAPNRVSSYLSPDLAVDGAGNAVVVVSIFDATIGVDRASVWVAIGSPTGTWTPQQRITDPTVPVDAYATRAAISPDGALALVGWIDHYHGTVQVSKLSGGVWGTANTIGKGTAWSSSQEVFALDAASSLVARAIWKNAKTGTQTMAVSYDLLNPRILPLTFEFNSPGLERNSETAVSGEESTIPIMPKLLQNYPNPFNSVTVIRYQLPVNSWVTLKVFDVLGQEVTTLVNGVNEAGYKMVEWNASSVASGLYVYRLEAVSITNPTNSFKQTRNMILLK